VVTTLANAGWSDVVLLLIILAYRPTRMLIMRVVFKAYAVSLEKQIDWALKEAQRDDRLTFARSFWNRASQRRPKSAPPIRRIPASHRADTVPIAELSAAAQKPERGTSHSA
jgi:hypothetical protein